MQGPEPGRPSVSIPEFRALTSYRKIAQAIAASNRTPTPQSALSYSALNIVYLLPCSYRRKETHDGSLLRFPGIVQHQLRVLPPEGGGHVAAEADWLVTGQCLGHLLGRHVRPRPGSPAAGASTG